MTKYSNLSISAKRLHETLHHSCQWGCTPDGGMNRLSLNDDDKRVRSWFVAETKKLGCHHKIDAMGNIFAIRPGKNNNLAPIGLGSHLDTQPAGGRYDGILGVNSGLEVLKVIHENNVETYAPLAVVDWTNEEGARFPPAMVSSGVWAEAFTTEYGHSRADAEGATMKTELERIGFLGSEPCTHRSNPLSAHFEVHIEQGPILDEKAISVSTVQGVQSMAWYNIKITGREAHTGTTPMNRRADALLGAAKMIVATNEIVTIGDLAARQARATIAVINSAPQSVNTIAGHVQMSLDIRAPANQDVKDTEALCRERFAAIAKEHALSVDFENIWTCPATTFDATAVQCVREAVLEQGSKEELLSGAGHDSVYTARHIPTAMIFVRCRDGISHNPAEFSRSEDCAAGAQVLLSAYLRYDDHLRRKHER